MNLTKLTQILSLAAVVLTFGFGTAPAAAQDGPRRVQAPQDATEPFDEPVEEARSVRLATFKLANGNEVRFIGAPDEGEIFVGEVADAGPGERFLIDPETHPAKIYAQLAKEGAPAPRMLAQIDTEGHLAGRRKVRSVKGVRQVPASSLAAPPAPQAAGSGSCASGNAGANYFKTHHCNTLGGPGFGKSEGHCYNGAWNSLQKTSNSRRRATWTVMASCGGGTNKLRHFYRKASGYHTQLTVYVGPQKIAKWWSYKKGIKRYRRVRMEESNAAGWIRVWIKYHSEVAGGW